MPCWKSKFVPLFFFCLSLFLSVTGEVSRYLIIIVRPFPPLGPYYARITWPEYIDCNVSPSDIWSSYHCLPAASQSRNEEYKNAFGSFLWEQKPIGASAALSFGREAGRQSAKNTHTQKKSKKERKEWHDGLDPYNIAPILNSPDAARGPSDFSKRHWSPLN